MTKLSTGFALGPSDVTTSIEYEIEGFWWGPQSDSDDEVSGGDETAVTCGDGYGGVGEFGFGVFFMVVVEVDWGCESGLEPVDSGLVVVEELGRVWRNWVDC